MRCWRMRCWDIWRCGGKKKGGETWVGNKVFASTVRYRPNEMDIHIFTRDNKEDYISVTSSNDGVGIVLHWGYVNEPQMEVIKNFLLGLEDMVAIFIIWNFGGSPTAPTEWAEWRYNDEFMKKINDIYNSPTEENINALMAYIAEIAQEIQETWDYSKVPLQFSKLPQYDITAIKLSPHEINWKGLEYVRINYSIEPRQVDFQGWPETIIAPGNVVRQGRQGTDTGGYGTLSNE